MIDDWLYKQAASDAVAVIGKDDEITYRELLARATGLAERLPSQENGFVFIILNKSIDFIVSIIGVLGSGNAYVPVSPDQPRIRVEAMLAQARPVAIICTREYARQNPDLGSCPLIFADELRSAEIPRRKASDGSKLLRQRTSADAAYMIFTSGSTGKPKGVVVSHASLEHFIDHTIEVLRLTSDTRWLNVTPLYFDASLSDVFCTLAVGGVLVLQGPFVFPNEVLKRMVEHQVTHVLFTSSVLKLICSRFANLDAFDLGSLRVLWYGGEPCPINLLRKIKAACPTIQFVHGYGPTEVTHTTLWHLFTEVPETEGFMPIGRPLKDVKAYVLTKSGNPAARGEEGELYLGGPQLMIGYLADPEQTRLALVPDCDDPGKLMYRTGDFVRIDEDGNFVFCGRRDDLLKIRGILVHLAEVEAAMLTIPFVDDVVVLAVDATDGEKALVAFVSSEQPAELESPGLESGIAERLPLHMRPAVNIVMRTGELPLLSHGKLDREALRKGWREFASRSRSGKEKMMAL